MDATQIRTPSAAVSRLPFPAARHAARHFGQADRADTIWQQINGAEPFDEGAAQDSHVPYR